MSDLEPVGNKEITNAGVRGVGSTIGGIGLLLLTGVAGWFGGIAGLALGGVILALGASGMKSQSKADKTGGAIAMGAGALLAITGLAHFPLHIPLITGLARFTSGLVGLGAVGLIGYGVFNIVRFIRGLKSRR
jgi:hypothetical protein